MKIAFVGNHSVDFSTETHHRKTLEAMGHEVIAMQEAQVSGQVILETAKGCDLLIWTHTHGWPTPGMDAETVLQNLKARKIPTVTYHLDLWFGLNRQADLENDDFYKHIDHFFTVDPQMADWFNANTEVEGHYLRAGVFDEEAYMIPREDWLDTKHAVHYDNDVIFVGSKGYHPEHPWRPQLIDWLQETYGDRFKHYGGDGLGVMRGHPLNQLYAKSKVVVGDSLVLGFDYPGYWSDRVYETLGRGGFLLMPYIKGLETEFDLQQQLPTFKFGDFTNLKRQIDFYLTNDQLREVIRKNGHRKVLDNYTYKHRWATILKELAL